MPTDFLGGGENIRSKDFVAIHMPTELFFSCLVLDGASDLVRRQMRFTPWPQEPIGWMIEQAGEELSLFFAQLVGLPVPAHHS